jgi:type VI secretion system secreted protein VgrG
MPTFTQAERPLAIHTPLGEDVLLLATFRGSESISRLFRYDVDLLAEADTAVPFGKLLGAGMTVEFRMADGNSRYFDGIVKRFAQGERDELFTRYRAELVPRMWLLTKKTRSRIFQQMTVPDILRQVFAGLQVVFELAAQYYPRDYCVQYRESDFDFASRLMEEEGIYYFFEHAKGSHQLVVTDIPHQHPTVPGSSTIIYEDATGDVREEARITSWLKAQEMRSGQYTLRDHCFEMPSTRLEAHANIDESVTVGQVVHNLRVGGNDDLEIYDYPGCYAQRFDGIAPHGAVRAQDLSDLFPDGDRTVKICMEREQAAGLEIQGAGDCGNFLPGYKFTLERHFDGDGAYVLIGVEHEARQSGFISGEDFTWKYENRFTCIPADLRYRPARETRKPEIAGVQTATVVGPEGQEIFCDQYGRIKVQFHWDREGKRDANSSCWLRVAQIWAGKRWGAFFWPRIGHEVVVAFEDGDPDRPIVVGSVYNGVNMPPMPLPATNMFCGIKSASVRGQANENFNGLTFVDVKGKEHLSLHSERHMILMAEHDVSAQNGRHHMQRVPGAQMVSVGSLPGIGGSSGGSGGAPTNFLGTVSGTPWGSPQPTAILGLSSSVVYGSAFTSSWPISFQLAHGSLMKIIVDPSGYEAAFPTQGAPMMAATSGIDNVISGVTGNLQLTLGNSVNIAMGRTYAVHIGPKKLELSVDDESGDAILTPKLGGLLGMIAILFQEAYALLGTSTTNSNYDDSVRGILVMAFQAAAQILFANLLCSAVSAKIAEIQKSLTDSMSHGAADANKTQELQKEIADMAEMGAPFSPMIVVQGLVVPILLESLSEITLSQTSSLP